ncbi:hypothetical protein O6B97_01185 [Campylobacter ureolyticus]|nr:hypothetical protein [Campylobacter ureolyticus]MCZ6157806.1 hypothetical protein [Campylobacter ureolyticus]MCZ6174780.1 hypothetical protein [Campylobacter ureolyticus]MCZ6185711.1 hypothetical protein [Campylobacter ureolyticus]
MVNISINNLGIAVISILGLICCVLFVFKAVMIGIEAIKELIF